MKNFIQTSNPYGLATPPAWFLTALFAYDPLLVIFPSTHAPVYRIARRTSSGRAQLNRVLKSFPDSEIFFRHRLWAWKSVEPLGIGRDGMTWQKLLLEIPEYDQQRFASGSAVADHLDAMEQGQEEALNRDIQSGLDALGHDAYVHAAHRIGTRVSRAGRSGQKSGRPVYQPPNFGGGSAIFVGR